MDCEGLPHRVTDWCMKNINKTHNGCPKKKICFYNSTFLTKALKGKFRVMSEMSLAATQCLLMTYFISKLARTVQETPRRKH
ncbi:hypothetical protein LIER_08887 [Lithospermum erythrorhizon]|uniref:Uncharacterized protein n=1 Tax=Lithospermum erythrorhizon TaxID=34254 RepID=A0AAV3PFN8_LITER